MLEYTLDVQTLGLIRSRFECTAAAVLRVLSWNRLDSGNRLPRDFRGSMDLNQILQPAKKVHIHEASHAFPPCLAKH